MYENQRRPPHASRMRNMGRGRHAKMFTFRTQAGVQGHAAGHIYIYTPKVRVKRGCGNLVRQEGEMAVHTADVPYRTRLEVGEKAARRCQEGRMAPAQR